MSNLLKTSFVLLLMGMLAVPVGSAKAKSNEKAEGNCLTKHWDSAVVSGSATGAGVAGFLAAIKAAGLTAAAHSSGAAIVTASGSYVAGTLGTIGATVLSAPVVVVGGTVAVVGGGSYLAYECYFGEEEEVEEKTLFENITDYFAE